jgi:flagellar hook-length control protein FliK
MIHEISNAGQFISQSGNANVEEGSGENVKEAFFALLQGIAGIIPQASSMHAHLPQVQRITDERITDERITDERITDDRPQKSESMNTSKEKQYSDLPDESRNQTAKGETRSETHSSSGKPEFSKNNESRNVVRNEETQKSASEDTPVSKDGKVALKEEATPKQYESARIVHEGKDFQNNIQGSNRVAEVKSSISKEVKSESKAPLDTGMTKPEEVLNTIENQLKHAGKEVEQVLSKAQTGLDTSRSHDARKAVSELHSQIEVLSTKNEGNDNSLGKALFNMLVKADTTHAPDVQNMDANKMHLHNYLNAFTMQRLAGEGEIKSMLSLKSEVESIITTAKNNLERSQAHAKTNGTEAGPRQQAYVDKVKEVMEKAVINKTTDSVTVKIDPPHLGEITVKVVQKGKEVYAKLTSESSEVEHTLRTRMHELQGVLQSLGFKTDEVHVSIGNDFEDSTQFSRGNHAGHENANRQLREERSSSNSQGGRDQGVKDVLRAFPRTQSTLDEGGWVA